jgi:peptidoglycan glycosyltransferase
VNAPIRRVGVGILAIFTLLIANLAWLQLVQAKSLDASSANGRRLIREYASERGPIVSGDGVLLAESVPTDGRYRYQRRYPEGALAVDVVGYKSLTFGTVFAEAAYDDLLAGGERPLDRDGIIDRLEGRSVGNTVALHLDMSVQRVAVQQLNATGKRGAVVALDPRTGAVLAMVSNPSYDPNPLASNDAAAANAEFARLKDDPANPLLPRAYRETYPPGSTFKIVTASAALEAGRSPDERFPVLRELKLPTTDKTLPNNEVRNCGGTFTESFARSCNTVFGQLALDVGAQRLVEEAERYGWNGRIPMDWRTAVSVIPSADTFVRDLPGVAKSGIGQENVTATPLQVAMLSQAIANGGVSMRPQIAKEARDAKGQVIRTWSPETWRRVVSPQTAAVVRDFMRAAVDGGTAGRAAIPGVPVAGKTGSAQSGDRVQAWFTGFAPADDPRVAVAVLVEDGGSGGGVAAPIARAVMEEALR